MSYTPSSTICQPLSTEKLVKVYLKRQGLDDTTVEAVSSLSKKVGQLSILAKMTIRYTRDRGEPDPTPAVPYEAVLDYKEFEKLLEEAKNG